MTEYSKNQIEALFNELTSRPDMRYMGRSIDDLYEISEHEADFNPYFTEAMVGIFKSFTADKGTPENASGNGGKLNAMLDHHVTPKEVTSYIGQHEVRLQDGLPQRIKDFEYQATLEPEELEQLPNHLTDPYNLAMEAAALDPYSRLQVYDHTLDILCGDDYRRYQQEHPDFNLAGAVGVTLPSLEAQAAALKRSA